MTVVSYVGRAGVRKISGAALSSAGFNVPGGIIWSKANGYSVDIADPTLVAFLIATGGFVADGIESFVDAIADIGVGGGSTEGLVTQQQFLEQGPSGRQLAFASTDVQTATFTAVSPVPGLDIEFEVTNRPVEVEFYASWIMQSAAGVYPVASIHDGAGEQIQVVPAAMAANNVGAAICKETIEDPGTYVRRAYVGRIGTTGTARLGSTLATTVSHIKAVEQ